MTILITGSAGKTASRLTELLAPSHPILIASRKPNADSARPTVKFDWLDESTWQLPFQHEQAQKSPITAAYLVTPDIQDARDNVIPFVKLAREKGVKRFVLLSAWENPAWGPLLGRAHGELEVLGQEGVEWTVLRPQFFMENFAEPIHLPSIRTEGKIYTACGPGKKPFISTKDIAAVAYRALVDEKAHNTDYVLTGPEALTYDDVAAVFSEVLGRKIEHVTLSKDELKKKLLEWEFPADIAEYLPDLDERISKGLGWETTDKVQTITGQEPRTLKQIVTEMRDVWE